ncbi:MAG: DNA-deoxyinosine glycosylase [Clostridiaceae bacterium]|nr:DNA-deoxyinosine glycosylase [Clostridiaceae bacterium]
MKGDDIILIHPYEPVYDKNSKIFILGTFPSVASREANFFYGHPRNRFWKVLACLTQNDVPQNIEEKKSMLLDNNIALWDVIKSCDIEKSKDSSIINPVPNDLSEIFAEASIKAVFANGRKAQELYTKFCYPKTGIKAIFLPSTSPANASYNMERLIKEWSIILEYFK